MSEEVVAVYDFGVIHGEAKQKQRFGSKPRLERVPIGLLTRSFSLPQMRSEKACENHSADHPLHVQTSIATCICPDSDKAGLILTVLPLSHAETKQPFLLHASTLHQDFLIPAVSPSSAILALPRI